MGKFSLRGYSKFEFRPTESFQYIGGIWLGRCRRCERAGDTPFLAAGIERT
jgi:hypothetical protein